MAVNLAEPSVSSSLAARDVLALKRVFETIHSRSCPTSFNFHMHTVCSDGRLQPESLIQQAIAIGLKGLAITDHHTTDGYQQAQRWLNEYQNTASEQTPLSLPHLWTGIEVTSELLDTEVHILGYAFDPSHSLMRPYLQHHAPQRADALAECVVTSIHGAGGVAVLAHPVRYRRSPEELIPAAVQIGIDGVETYYAYDNPNPWRTSSRQTEQVKHLSTTHNVLNTCGTDTHGLSLLQRL
ncbi:MAG: PHP domain-containing protein [Leptolyngbyaceae cyanobacterium RU_5_1]|nr:PHP domain-containing protein [Leptolyngbyaceae cyanobacterium RU_5_1]